MNVSTWLKTGSLSCWALTCWTWPLGATTSDCVSALRIDASETVRETMRSRLQKGRLSEVSAEHCRQASVRLEQRGGRWELQFTHGDTSIQRDVKSPELAAVWVESWLVPATSIEANEPSPVGAAGTSNNAIGTGTSSSFAPAAPLGFEASASWYATAGSTWMGPGFRFHNPIAGMWWLEPHFGFGYAVTNQPSEASRTLQVGAAFGRDILRTPHWFLRPAGEIGFMNLLWSDRLTEVRASGPLLGAEFAAGYSLTRSVWLVGRLNASLLFADRTQTDRMRVCVDDRCNDTERMNVVTSTRSLTSTWVGGLGFGLLIRLGDFT